MCIRDRYYPFIIGKQENLVDHVLNRETVSRLHLRIDQKAGHYYEMCIRDREYIHQSDGAEKPVLR